MPGAGALSGTSLSLSSRIEVSTLSPQSCILGDGNAGGSFAAFLKRAGYDQIVVTGRVSSPRYLWIDDGTVELRDAAQLMGKSTWETTDTLKQVHGKDISVACIGQAGETWSDLQRSSLISTVPPPEGAARLRYAH